MKSGKGSRDGYAQRALREGDIPQWHPLTNEAYEKFLYEVKPHVPEYVKISRIQRIVPQELVVRGPSNVVDRNIFKGICRCISHRTQALAAVDPDADFTEYRTATVMQGSGYYVEVTSKDGTVLGYGRLSVSPVEEAVSLVRQLRTFGAMLNVGNTNREKRGVQHIGIGKSVMQEMERISRERGCTLVKVNAGVGVREYFERLGYVKDGFYMTKHLGRADGQPLS